MELEVSDPASTPLWAKNVRQQWWPRDKLSQRAVVFSTHVAQSGEKEKKWEEAGGGPRGEQPLSFSLGQEREVL